jgi:hypothetical protein
MARSTPAEFEVASACADDARPYDDRPVACADKLADVSKPARYQSSCDWIPHSSYDFAKFEFRNEKLLRTRTAVSR